MPVSGKMKVTVYLDPENVEYIRSQWVRSGQGESHGRNGHNICMSKLVDSYLAELVKGLKAGKAVDKKGRFNWVDVLKEMFFMKPV